jgi:fucose permease
VRCSLRWGPFYDDDSMTTMLPDEPPVPAAVRGGTARRAGLGLLVLVFVGFISLGLPDGLLGVGWPSIRHEFGLSLDALGPLLIMTMIGYLLASLASGWIVERTGIGPLLVLSCLLTAVGLFGYALAPVWLVMVSLGVVAGLGAGAIDAGLNGYVALHHSPRLLNWLHACFGIGPATGPAIMTAVLQAGHSWRLGYAIVGSVQLGLGICFLLTLTLWPDRSSHPSASPALTPTLSQRERGSSGTLVVVLSVLLFFLYTGIETTAGQWSYSLFVESRAVEPQTASLWVSIFWGALAVGRILSGIVANRFSATTLVRGAAAGLLVGASLIWLNLSHPLSFVGLGLIGLAAATVFPTLISATPARVGAKRASRVIGFEVAAASLGIGGIPALAGVLAARAGLEVIPLLLVVATLGFVALHEAVVRAAPRASTDS